MPKAVKQTQLKLKSLLEKYFASELKCGEWTFVEMMYTNKINTEQPLCTSCCSFVIQGPSELLAKLSTIEVDLKERWFPNHAEYEFLVQQDEGKGWPDFKNEQAKIMLMGQQFVFFISPWSSGKTIYHRHEREGSHVGDTESKRKAVLCGCGYAGI